jgi:hypothetical protein
MIFGAHSRLQAIFKASHEKEEKVEEKTKSKIITTNEELKGFYVVKGILCEIIDSDRITLKDNISYCVILLDNNG